MTDPIPRRRVLQGMAAGAGLALVGTAGASALTRSLSPGAARAPRAGVKRPGTRPDPSKPEGVDLLPHISHIVIYMQENRSWDSYFGMLGRGDGFTLQGGVPTNSNPDADGKAVTVSHNPDTCNTGSGAGQNWNGTHRSVNGGAMDGFARISPGAMTYWDGSDLPFYHGLAGTFVLCDRWFASAPAQTYPNRRYLQAATSVGLVETDTAKVLARPDAPNGTIWERLNDIGVDWLDYCYDLPDLALFPNVWKANKDKIRSIGNFLADCAAGRLPAVSIVSPGASAFSEETPADIQRGESYSSLLVNAVMQSPDWGSTVMLFTYDEHGGLYDHVPPPAAIPPDSIKPDIGPGDVQAGFDMYGIRVPSVVISPFAKAGYVSSVVHDHTSVLRLVETKYNLGAMTYRDANASDLLDCLDFSAKAFADPPDLPAPALPDAKSACEAGPGLPTPVDYVAPTTTTTTTTTAPAGPAAAPAATPVSGAASFTG